MAFDSLTEKLQNVFRNLRSKGRLTEDDVKAALREVKMALLDPSRFESSSATSSSRSRSIPTPFSSWI